MWYHGIKWMKRGMQKGWRSLGSQMLHADQVHVVHKVPRVLQNLSKLKLVAEPREGSHRFLHKRACPGRRPICCNDNVSLRPHLLCIFPFPNPFATVQGVFNAVVTCKNCGTCSSPLYSVPTVLDLSHLYYSELQISLLEYCATTMS